MPGNHKGQCGVKGLNYEIPGCIRSTGQRHGRNSISKRASFVSRNANHVTAIAMAAVIFRHFEALKAEQDQFSDPS